MWLWLEGYGKTAGAATGRPQSSLCLFNGGRVHAPQLYVIAILRAIDVSLSDGPGETGN